MTLPDLLVLHALRCIGFAGLPRIAAATGLPESDVESELIDLAVAGLVTHVPGGWGLTEAGRAADAVRIAAELDSRKAAVSQAYERFLLLNPELLDLCTAWQLRSVTDPAAERRVLGLLADLDRRAAVVCADLAAALPRFGRYRVRLAGALARVHAGDLDYVTDNFEAYHTVWFQLHEDLLATLGIPR